MSYLGLWFDKVQFLKAENPWQWEEFISVEQTSEAVLIHFLRTYSKSHEAEAMEEWCPVTYSWWLISLLAYII